MLTIIGTIILSWLVLAAAFAAGWTLRHRLHPPTRIHILRTNDGTVREYTVEEAHDGDW